MDARTNAAVGRLERRLQGIFNNAAQEAERNHAAILNRLARFEREIDAGQWAHLSETEIRRAKENYFFRINRAEAITRNIAADLASSGETAARMIQNEMLNQFELGYRANVGNILGQLPQNMQANINWAMYNRNQLQALLVGDVPGISQSPFTQIAYDRLSGEVAINRMNTRLQNMFAESIVSGDATRRTLTRKIQQITGFELSRCRTIARTEGARVQNQGRYLAAEQAKNEYGIRTVKIWNHIPVAIAPRDNHMDLDGTQADENGYFNVGGHRALYPLDPSLPASEVVNCHCTHINRVVRTDGRFYGEQSANNTLTYDVDRGIVNVDRTELFAEANSITQETVANGGINRNYYDENGRQTKQISNHNHGNPKTHPYGANGEHAHDYVWDSGNMERSKPREITVIERQEAGDML